MKKGLDKGNSVKKQVKDIKRASFSKTVDEFIQSHKDVLQELAKR